MLTHGPLLPPNDDKPTEGEKGRTAAALALSDAQFRQLADAMPQIVWTALPDGTIAYFNERWYQYAGCSRTAEPDLTWRAAIHPDDLQNTERGWTASVQSGAPFELEMRMRQHSTGLYRWFLVRAVASTDAAGATQTWNGTSTDIDDQKRSLEELRVSEARFRTLIMALPAAVYTTDPAGRITLYNKHAVELWGREPDLEKDRWCGTDKIFRTDGTILPVAESPMAVAARENRSLRGEEILIERPDGTRANVLSHPEPLHNAAGEVIETVHMLVDVTPLKLLEEKYRQSQKMEAFGQLAGGVAHDFNNLLTIIACYSYMLLAKMERTDKNREMVESIRYAGERAAALTRQLLAFSRKQLLEPKVINLNEAVSNVEKLLRRLIGEDINFNTRLEPNLGSVKVDPSQIEQVVMNLAVNARDAMPKGGRLTIETANVEWDAAYCQVNPECRPGQYVMVSMTDTGTGMTPAVRARIFEPFFTTKAPGKGTGLGLATVFGIVKQSDGFITVYSEVDHGTSFKVYLPTVGEKPKPAHASGGIETLCHGTETLLLAEDEAAVRDIAKLVLLNQGYTVLEVKNGREAIELLDRHPGTIDLVITDVVMPEMSGRQLAEALRARRPLIPVMFMSGYTDDAVVRHGIIQAEDAFLQKPFSPIALALKVREVLDTVKAAAEAAAKPAPGGSLPKP